MQSEYIVWYRRIGAKEIVGKVCASSADADKFVDGIRMKYKLDADGKVVMHHGLPVIAQHATADYFECEVRHFDDAGKVMYQ